MFQTTFFDSIQDMPDQFCLCTLFTLCNCFRVPLSCFVQLFGYSNPTLIAYTPCSIHHHRTLPDCFPIVHFFHTIQQLWFDFDHIFLILHNKNLNNTWHYGFRDHNGSNCPAYMYTVLNGKMGFSFDQLVFVDTHHLVQLLSCTTLVLLKNFINFK